MKPIVVIDINLFFIRYVVYELNNKIHEKLTLQMPWTPLSKHIGEYVTLDEYSSVLDKYNKRK